MVDALSPADLASYPGNPAADATQGQVDLIVRLTNGQIAEITGTLESIPARIESIALEVAARAFRNPDGASEERVDDYATKRPAGQESAGVYLTAWERAQVIAAITDLTSERAVYVVSLAGD